MPDCTIRCTIRAILDEDEPRVIELHRQAFPHACRTADHQRWKYTGNPFGHPVRMGAFAEDGTLAAHAGAYAMPMVRATTNGLRQIHARQAGDSMTDPRFRGSGHGRRAVLARAMQRVIDGVGEAGLDRVYGVVAERSMRFYLRHVDGLERLFEVPFTVGRVVDGRLPSRRRPRPAPDYTIAISGELDARLDRLFARVAPAYGLLTRRDTAYLDWRYRQCPDRDYLVAIAWHGDEAAGWGVFLREGDDMIWGDALFDPEHLDAVRPLVSRVASQESMHGVRRIRGWFRRRPDWWARTLAECGLVREPDPHGLGFIGGCYPDAPSGAALTSAELRENLYLTMGDSDLF